MSNINEVYELVLETAPTLLPAKRARVYRGLAEIIGDERFAAALISHAEDCERLEQAERQLLLKFRGFRP